MSPQEGPQPESAAASQTKDSEMAEAHMVVFDPPHPPTLVATSPFQMTLQWRQLSLKSEADASRIKGLAQRFSLMLKLETGVRDAASKWSCAYMGSELLEQVKGLRPGKSYSFRVECTVDVPEGADFRVEKIPSSESVTFSTPATVPSEPRLLSLGNKAPNTLTVKWQTPIECGGPEISAYTLAMSSPEGMGGLQTSFIMHGQEFQEVYHGSEPRFKISNLQPGMTYSFLAKATNAVGDSPWSKVAHFTTKARVPSPPGAPSCRPLSQDCMAVAWEPPCDNGAPITLYQCFMTDGRGGEFQLVYTGAEPCFQRSSMKGGVQYKTRVFATNAAGKSLAGEIGILALPALLPSAPASLSASKITRTGFHLGWYPPDEDGGSPVQQYTVDLMPVTPAAVSEGIPHDWCQIHVSQGPNPPTSCSFDGLTAGCKYMLRVRAVNEAGPGPYSRAVSFTTGSCPPYPPGQPEVVRSNSNSLALEWPAPSHDGGAAINAYNLEMDQDGGGFEEVARVEGGLRSVTVPDLRPAQTYHFRVRAANSEGHSDFGPTGEASTQAAAPGKPPTPELSEKLTASSLSLRWEPPAENGAPLTLHETHVWLAHSLTSPPLTALPRHIVNDCSSRPSSENGVASEDGEECMDCREGVPHGTAAVSTTSEEAHSETGQKTRGNKAVPPVQSQTSKSPACTVSGLEADTEYIVKVRGCNSAGAGEWSQPVLFRTGPAPPSAPTAVSASGISCSQLAVEWSPPHRLNGAPVTCYQAEISSTSKRAIWHPFYTGREPFCQAGGLRGGVSYSLRVRAANERGWGAWSAPCAERTLPGPPDAPEAPTFSGRTSTSVRVSWQPPAASNGAPVLIYRVEGRSEGDAYKPVYSGQEMQCKAGGLAPASQHSFRVQAVNSAGAGPWSADGSVLTKLSPPAPPNALSLSIQDRVCVRVAWEVPAADKVHSAAVSHEVEAVPLQPDGPTVKQSSRGGACELLLTTLKPGIKYKVSVRSAGADGSGHSSWSDAEVVCLPTLTPRSTAAPSGEMSRPGSARPGSAAGSGGEGEGARAKQAGATSGRRRPVKTAEVLQQQVHSAKARGRPVKPTLFTPLHRFLRSTMGTWIMGVLATVAVVIVMYKIAQFFEEEVKHKGSSGRQG